MLEYVIPIDSTVEQSMVCYVAFIIISLEYVIYSVLFYSNLVFNSTSNSNPTSFSNSVLFYSIILYCIVSFYIFSTNILSYYKGVHLEARGLK